MFATAPASSICEPQIEVGTSFPCTGRLPRRFMEGGVPLCVSPDRVSAQCCERWIRDARHVDSVGRAPKGSTVSNKFSPTRRDAVPQMWYQTMVYRRDGDHDRTETGSAG